MDPQVARRYAAALFTVAQKQNSVREAQDDLDAIASVFESKPEFREAFESPKIDPSKKRALLDRVFSDRARPITLRLLRMMVDKGREENLLLIRDAFTRMREEAEKVLRIQISSAYPLNEAEVRGVADRIAAQTGKRVFHETTVDPSLVGGVTVRYGDFVLDGSVAGRLRRFRERLYFDVLKQG